MDRPGLVRWTFNRRLAVHVAVAFLAVVATWRLPVQGSTLRAPVTQGVVAAHTDDQELFLEALPEPGEGLLRFCWRFTGTTTHVAALAQANGDIQRLLAGVRYRVPFNLLTGDFQVRVVRALFETDRAVAAGWEHRIVARPSGRESLWHIADWFTGRGDNYRSIREANELADDNLTPGQIVIIPAPLLRPGFRSALPPSSPYYLEYGSGRQGNYAIYRLKPGEALYSSVVIRFTGRVFADDVNSLAREVAERSGIADVTDIPVGYEVRVPFELLLPEFLPSGHPRRQEYEEGLIASAHYSIRVRAQRLQGVTVVLDAGHGGKDVGASMGGVWESLYVYDIMLRTRRLLEERTAATVISTTLDDGSNGVVERDKLPYSNGHRVLTTPNYPIEDAAVGVHLRWYLVNSIYRQTVEKGSDPDKIVFISIHADSLHASLRGAMAYIPGARYRGGTYGKSGAVYASREEVRERPRVSFSKRELVRSEGLARDLAQHILGALADLGLSIHPDKPVRERVIRKRRAWVPAVLRYGAVPAQILLEVCNLANREDLKLIQTQSFRSKVADAIVRGILDYYGYPEATIKAAVTSGG